MLDEVSRAVRAGDAKAVFSLLARLPDGAVSGAEGAAMLRAAVQAGDARVVESLMSAGADPFAPWPVGAFGANGYGDALAWAADHGDCPVMNELIIARDHRHRHRASMATAAALARAWLDVDIEDELRRRLDLPFGGTVERDVKPCRFDVGAPWMRVTAPNGRAVETLTAHRAVLTMLESALGMPVSPEVALERALHHADPDSCDWVESVHAAVESIDPYRWAAARLDDPRVGVRRFAADIVHRLSFDARPFGADAVVALRARLAVEVDSYTLLVLIAAFSGYEEPGPLPEVRRHLRHADPRVRQVVANVLGASPIAEPSSVTALVELAGDHDPGVRATALHRLAEGGTDAPAVHAVFAAHRHDPDPNARARALGGLATFGDEPALAELWRLTRETGDEETYWYADFVSHLAARRTSS